MSSTYCNGTENAGAAQPVATGSVGMAFLLVVIAGLSTTIGSTMACCMRPHHTHWLAIALGLSAGVMIYVSFVEIFSTKAVSAFESTMDSGKAYATATSLFFAGIVCTGILDWFVHYLMHRGRKASLSVSRQHVTTREDVPNMSVGPSPVSGISNADCCNGIHCNHDTTSFSPSASVRVNFHLDEHHIDTTIWYDGQTNDINLDTPTTSSTLDLNGPTICPPSTTTDTNIIPHRCSPSAPRSTNIHSHTNPVSPPQDHSGCVCMHDLDVILAQAEQRDAKDKPHGHVRDSTPPLDDQHKLSQMSFMTGFALALHNFPEGIATFVAALADPTLGVALCVAISLHNIPEGICVSMPVYYATGSRKKAFLYSFLSGVSEPVGAAVGYLALRNVLSDLVYGILFSVVAGMMIYISFKELLPTARRYDSSDRYVTTATFVGMSAMAVSLVMFAL